MSYAIIMTFMNITKFVLINELEEVHGMFETCRLKNVVIWIKIMINILIVIRFFGKDLIFCLCLS